MINHIQTDVIPRLEVSDWPDGQINSVAWASSVLRSRLRGMATDTSNHFDQVSDHRAGSGLSSGPHPVEQDLPAEAAVDLHGIVHSINLG